MSSVSPMRRDRRRGIRSPESPEVRFIEEVGGREPGGSWGARGGEGVIVR